MRGSWHAESLLAINWNDADDNNAFHGKQIVMDLDGTISTEVAIIKKKQDYDDIETMGLALSNDGEPVPSEALHTGGLIPQGAKNVEIAKDFLKFLIQPEVLNAYLKAGLGRNIPCMLSIAKTIRGWQIRTEPLIPSRGCSARRCRISGYTTRPTPASRTNMYGPQPGPRLR